MGGFGDNITITGTGISDVMREYIRACEWYRQNEWCASGERLLQPRPLKPD